MRCMPRVRARSSVFFIGEAAMHVVSALQLFALDLQLIILALAVLAIAKRQRL